MDKDEVLSRAQNRKSNKMDEMELDILNRGSKVGLLLGLVGCLIIMVLKMIAGAPWHDVYAIYCLMVCGQWLYKWLRLKEKRDLCIGILWGTVSIGLFVGYLTEIF